MAPVITALATFCSIAVTLAHPPPRQPPWHDHDDGHGGDPLGHEWSPPGPFDSRSPCPGLNALANHGWLPRSGKDISYEQIQSAATNAYNFGPNVYLDAFLMANETFKLSTTGSSLTINLQDLARHDAIEADGSQSRNDFYFGDDLHYDASVFAPVAADLGLDDYGEDDAYVTVETAAKARAARQVAAKAVNPTFNASEAQVVGSIGTTALYLTTLWDFDAEAAPKAWVKAFFEEDRIAYSDGYVALKRKTFKFLSEMNQAVASVPV
ncbi:uncharacterized protein LTR77_009533 [Saxophila tyrrhenica]|uniref:Heme haloperoxidase family profile domain-containing protein n=1 Tax=Saxophila tyrrhenica TaxID=1690608 RepID=A0AAV9NXX8_9PEZI|nr:hypothetical protein LTR77_009533 [Saxophila tyrrhenica]